MIVFTILYIMFLSWVSGYRDMARFVYKGTWERERLAGWLPYWEASQSSKLDPFHVAGGFMWLLIFVFILTQSLFVYLNGELLLPLFVFVIGTEWYYGVLTVGLHVLLYWFILFYWQRNIFMHIWGVARQFNEWKYINPLWKYF